MCELWAEEFEHKNPGGGGGLDSGLAREGMALFRQLPATADREVLLCTDLHAGNVLAAEREPWLVIDPKPYVGDPTYDALQHMLNCDVRLTTEPHRLLRRMAELLSLDPDRLRLWLFARASRNHQTGRPWQRSLGGWRPHNHPSRSPIPCGTTIIVHGEFTGEANRAPLRVRSRTRRGCRRVRCASRGPHARSVVG